MDIDVRKALQMAIPLDEIANIYYRGFSDPTPYPGFGSLVQGFYTPFEDQPEDVRMTFEYNPREPKSCWHRPATPMALTSTCGCRHLRTPTWRSS